MSSLLLKLIEYFYTQCPRTLVMGSDHISCWTPGVSLPLLCSSVSETSCTSLTFHPRKRGSQCPQYRNDDKIHVTKSAIVTAVSSVTSATSCNHDQHLFPELFHCPKLKLCPHKTVSPFLLLPDPLMLW